MIPIKLAGILFVCFWSLTSVANASDKSKHSIEVEFDGARLVMQAFSDVRVRTDYSTANKRLFPCSFVDQRLECFSVGKTRKEQPYGYTFRFARPIAIVFGGVSAPIDNADSEGESWHAKASDPKYVATLKDFQFRPSTAEEIADAPNGSEALGMDGEDHIFSKVSATQGGAIALEMWQGLLNKRPTRECIQSEDYCSIILRAKWNSASGLARCYIVNAPIGLGLPFNCQMVAIKIKDDWHVLSFNGPAQCEGCGAAAGATCVFEKSSDFDASLLADKVVSVFQAARTNIKLEITKRTNGSIVLSGRNKATPSKFYAGYFDKSFAIYTISKSEFPSDDEAKPEKRLMIEGLFNLLVSSTRSQDDIKYREIGGGRNINDLVWFQKQVMQILERQVIRPLGLNASCDVAPIL